MPHASPPTAPVEPEPDTSSNPFNPLPESVDSNPFNPLPESVDSNPFPSLYQALADWWPVLSAPADYAEEAEFFRRTLLAASTIPVHTVLELGSGGGNNASHMKQHFQLTLVDLSPGMLAVSRELNPECEHIQGDMRSVRLGQQFDAVFIHDAIDYMATADDLRQAIETAFVHCRPGGVALFVPDHTRETFTPATSHGGHDGTGRALRYLEWTWDPDPADSTFFTDMVYVLHGPDQDVRCVVDRHVCGLFSQADWLRIIAETGFQPQMLPFEHSEVEPGTMQMFVGIRGLQQTWYGRSAMAARPIGQKHPRRFRPIWRRLIDSATMRSGVLPAASAASPIRRALRHYSKGTLVIC